MEIIGLRDSIKSEKDFKRVREYLKEKSNIYII